jgi:hypothetical protein
MRMNIDIKFYQPINEDKLKQYIDIYLVQEQYILDGSYFFFDAFSAPIELIKVIDNTRYNNLKAYDETTDSEVDFNFDSRGFIRRPGTIRTCARFPFYHDINNLDLSRYQIFSFEQLNSNEE